jgi:hypothetical protein
MGETGVACCTFRARVKWEASQKEAARRHLSRSQPIRGGSTAPPMPPAGSRSARPPSVPPHWHAATNETERVRIYVGYPGEKSARIIRGLPSVPSLQPAAQPVAKVANALPALPRAAPAYTTTMATAPPTFTRPMLYSAMNSGPIVAFAPSPQQWQPSYRWALHR